MALNQVQQDFVNGAARPQMEVIVRILHELDTFVEDYDALQGSADALPTDSTVLDDAGSAPRDDAPELTGAQLQTLRNVSENMSLEINAATKDTLISKMVRPLAIVLKIS
jgi:histidine ammonia-lyase